MASGGTKCPVCGKSVVVGLVSQTLIQHEDKHGFRCAGTGTTPAVSARSGGGTGGSRSKTGPGARSAAGSAADSKTPRKGGVTVRKLDVDPEVLKERQERSERMRNERAEAARERNAIGFSYFDEPKR
jgi:hypothetical protein